MKKLLLFALLMGGIIGSVQAATTCGGTGQVSCGSTPQRKTTSSTPEN